MRTGVGAFPWLRSTGYVPLVTFHWLRSLGLTFCRLAAAQRPAVGIEHASERNRTALECDTEGKVRVCVFPMGDGFDYLERSPFRVYDNVSELAGSRSVGMIRDVRLNLRSRRER